MTSPPSNETEADFSVSYEGPAVDDHTMPVRDLAPALLALGQAFDRANGLLNGPSATVSLDIRATRDGSFEIALLLKQLYDGGVSVFSGDFVNSAANIKELFFGGGVGTVGLLALIKWLKGRVFKAISEESGNVVIEVDNTKITIPAHLLKLVGDSFLREQIEAVIRPVSKAGIERVIFRDERMELERVEKAEVPYFEQSGTLDYESQTEIVIPRQRLKPASVNFTKDGKWRLSDGEKTRWYGIKDSSFMDEVNAGTRRFGSADLFVCEVVMTQSTDVNGNLHMDYAITDVISHITPPEQPPLPLTDPASG